MFSYQKGIKLELKNRKISGKCTIFGNYVNNMFLNNSWVEGEIKRQIRKYNIRTK